MERKIRLSKKLEYGKLLTPLPDRDSPIYRWFQMKESFSGALVKMLLNLWKPIEGLVLDPFCGAGTTMLACKEMGIDGIGLEIHPFLHFITKAKIQEYDVARLKDFFPKVLTSSHVDRVEVPPLVRRVFPLKVLHQISSYRDSIDKSCDKNTRDFFRLALVRAAMRCSWVKKDGAVIKTRYRKLKPLAHELKRALTEMLEDVYRFPRSASRVHVLMGDARRIPLKNESVGAVITSPPYLFKSEYLREFSVEQWITTAPAPPAKHVINTEIPEAYFEDLSKVLAELHRVCAPKSKLCVAISDGGSKRGVIDVLSKLCDLARDAGLKVKKVVVVNERWCTTPSRKKVGILRESLVFMEKPA
jgi:DNA modification methylase